jgi:hypothetical protein
MSDDERGAMAVRITRDHLYIDAEAYDRHLAPVASVALLRDGDTLSILPVLAKDSGGFYVKQINARGDRAIHAADFLRLNGIDETIELKVAAAWSGGIAGYSVRDFFGHGRTTLGGN